MVEETPGRLEYEVALYKEAPPIRVGNNSNSELPVDQAVPIGTKLQLRARINPDSGMLILSYETWTDSSPDILEDKISSRNYWVFGFCQSSGVIRNRKNVLETGSVCILR